MLMPGMGPTPHMVTQLSTLASPTTMASGLLMLMLMPGMAWAPTPDMGTQLPMASPTTMESALLMLMPGMAWAPTPDMVTQLPMASPTTMASALLMPRPSPTTMDTVSQLPTLAT